jgi:hypothetical protein
VKKLPISIAITSKTNELIPIDELAKPKILDKLIAIVKQASGGKRLRSGTRKELERIIKSLASLYRPLVKIEGSSTLISEQREEIQELRDISQRLYQHLSDMDKDSKIWLWQAFDEKNRRLNIARPRGLICATEATVAVSELATASALAFQRLSKTKSAKGGPFPTAKVSDVHLQAAGEIGCVYEWLTGKKPKRIVRRRKRKGVKKGMEYIEAGPWNDFLAVALEAIFGSSKGVSGHARVVAKGMEKNPQDYWTSLIHK